MQALRVRRRRLPGSGSAPLYLALVVFSTTSGARAATARHPPGFDLQLRTGVGLATGALGIQGKSMSDAVVGQFPLGVDLGYLVIPELMIGAYGSYGFVIPSSDCSDDCSGHALRAGGQLQFYARGTGISGWLGFGLGYEALTYRRTANYSYSASGTSPVLSSHSEETTTLRGLEFLSLQAGVDMDETSLFAWGPFLMASFGKFSTATVEGGPFSFGDYTPSYTPSSTVDASAVHCWLMLGLRVAFTVGAPSSSGEAARSQRGGRGAP